MNCFYHPDRPAVAQCPECSKGMCIKRFKELKVQETAFLNGE